MQVDFLSLSLHEEGWKDQHHLTEHWTGIRHILCSARYNAALVDPQDSVSLGKKTTFDIFTQSITRVFNSTMALWHTFQQCWTTSREISSTLLIVTELRFVTIYSLSERRTLKSNTKACFHEKQPFKPRFNKINFGNAQRKPIPLKLFSSLELDSILIVVRPLNVSKQNNAI